MVQETGVGWELLESLGRTEGQDSAQVETLVTGRNEDTSSQPQERRQVGW